MSVVKGQGSVIPCTKPEKTCRKWILQAYLGRNKLTGKPEKKQRRFQGTKTEAKRALREFIAELEACEADFDQSVTFADYAKRWLERRQRDVRKGTLRKDGNRVGNLLMYLGSARMCDIDADMIAHVMDMLAAKGGVSGKPLSGSTRQGAFMTLNLVMGDAVREKLIPENPCKLVERKRRPKNDTREKDSLTLDEARMLQALLMEGEPDRHRVGVLLALNCGLSREEFTGLRWRDVDLSSRCLRVQNANTADDDELMTTKNGYRQRIVPLTAEVAGRLSSWKALQAQKLGEKGIRADDQTPVVSNPVGELMHPEAFGKWWRRYRAKIGLDGYGLHQLRHTYATILCASGTDIITASKLMGHCDTTTLARVYAHVIPEYARRAAANVGSVLNGDAGVEPVPFLVG